MNVNTKLIMLALAMTAAACGSSKSDPKPVAALVPHFADECPTFTAGVYQQIGEKDKLGAVKMSLRYNAKNLIELKRDDGDFFQVDGTVKTLKDGTAAGGCVKNSIKFNGAKGVQKGAGTLSFDSKGNMVLEGQVAEAGKTGNGGKLTLTRVGDIPTENQPVAAPTTCGNFLGEYVMPETDSLPYKSFTVAAFKVAGGIDTQVEIKTKDDKVTTVTLLKTVPDEPPSIFGECSQAGNISINQLAGLTVKGSEGEDITADILIQLLVVPGKPDQMRLLILDLNEETKVYSEGLVLTKK